MQVRGFPEESVDLIPPFFMFLGINAWRLHDFFVILRLDFHAVGTRLERVAVTVSGKS